MFDKAQLDHYLNKKTNKSFYEYAQKHITDPKLRFEGGVTLLIEFATFPHSASKIEWLLSRKNFEVDVNEKINQGFTALMAAAISGHVGNVKMLLKCGADPSALLGNQKNAYQLVEDRKNKTDPSDEKMHENYDNILNELKMAEEKIARHHEIQAAKEAADADKAAKQAAREALIAAEQKQIEAQRAARQAARETAAAAKLAEKEAQRAKSAAHDTNASLILLSMLGKRTPDNQDQGPSKSLKR